MTWSDPLLNPSIQTWQQSLPHGITLSCRACGDTGRPVLMFLHGFPEAAFVWDELLEHFSRPENGGYRCVAPNMRGYEHSSAPTDEKDYRAKFLVQDIAALIDAECGPDQPLAALVAHDWGGAVAWSLANVHPERLHQLVIINSPHPGPFLKALQSDPVQQAASAYMLFLVQADAAAQLAADDFTQLFGFLRGDDAQLGGSHSLAAKAAPWLSPAMEDRYRHVWRQGLDGSLNYYRASPLRPASETEDLISGMVLPPEILRVDVPTLVLWAQDDIALRPSLTQGLEQHIPDLKIVPIDKATHWVVHEQPQRVISEISQFLTPAQ
jgi:pimeloyl-ACP methyl ester carboxylesterase